MLGRGYNTTYIELMNMLVYPQNLGCSQTKVPICISRHGEFLATHGGTVLKNMYKKNVYVNIIVL